MVLGVFGGPIPHILLGRQSVFILSRFFYTSSFYHILEGPLSESLSNISNPRLARNSLRVFVLIFCFFFSSWI